MVDKKKEDNKAINNIEIILDIFFKKNSPFYIEGKRYTVFTYDWDNKISYIKKNGKMEMYNGDDSLQPTATPTSFSFNILIPSLNNLITRIQQTLSLATGTATITESKRGIEFQTLIENIIKNINNKIATIPDIIEDLLKINEPPYGRSDINDTLENIKKNSIPASARKLEQLVPIIDMLFTVSNKILFIWERMDALYKKYINKINVADVLDIDMDELYDISDEYHYLKGKACAQNLLDNVSDSKNDKQFKHLWEWCNNPKYNNWNSLQSISESCDNANKILKDLQGKDLIENDNDEILDLIDDFHMNRNIAEASGYGMINTNPTTNYFDLKQVSCNNANTNTTNITPLYKSYLEVMKAIDNDAYLTNMTDFRKRIDEYKKLSPTVVSPIVKSTVSTVINSISDAFFNMFGGAAIFLDIGEDNKTHSERDELRETNATDIQAEEMKSSTTVDADNKDKEKTLVSWNYGININIYLYPGDKIPLSAYASLYCSIKKDNIYNLFNNIKETQKDSKNTTLKKKSLKSLPLGIYSPVAPVINVPTNVPPTNVPPTNVPPTNNITQKNKQN
jgi:hypothetical protein